MSCFRILFAVLSLFLFACQANAFTGSAPPGTAQADYDPLTGEISVSVNGVNNWWVESLSSGLTGDEPSHIPLLPSSLPTNNDKIIGETSFLLASATDVSLGNVAAINLPADDLFIMWNAGLGLTAGDSASLHPASLLQAAPVSYVFNPNGMTNYPPVADLEQPNPIDIVADPLNITLDASSTTDDGSNAPLIYEWDLGADGTYEINTGTTPTLDIADVTATFGGIGNYPVRVRVFDGEFYSFRGKNLSLVIIPEPSSMLLMAFATLGLLTQRKRPES